MKYSTKKKLKLFLDDAKKLLVEVLADVADGSVSEGVEKAGKYEDGIRGAKAEKYETGARTAKFEKCERAEFSEADFHDETAKKFETGFEAKGAARAGKYGFEAGAADAEKAGKYEDGYNDGHRDGYHAANSRDGLESKKTAELKEKLAKLVKHLFE